MKLKKQNRVIAGLVIVVLAALLPGCGGEEVDETPPVISDITVSNITESSVTITWTTDEPTKGYLKYRCPEDGGDGISPLDGWDLKYTDESTFHTVVLEELPSGKLCRFQVIAHDASGNIATSEEMSFTTWAPDTTAPVILDVIVSDITETTARISWTTDEPARGNVKWRRPGSGIGVSFIENTEKSTSHSVILEKLKPDTVCCFRVIAKDASGNKSTSEDRCFTTAIEGDS